MAKFNKNLTGTTKTQNLAGGRAFKLAPELELLHGTLTTFLNDKYYETGADRMARLEALVRVNDPEFVAKLAVIARTEFHLRSVSHLLLGQLALTHNGDDLVKRAVVKFAERPDDLTEFASYVVNNSKDNVLTKQAKRGIRNALLKFDAYSLAKYRGEGKAMSLVDLFNLTHPNPKHATPEQVKAWDELMHGTLKSTETWESKISTAESDEQRTEEWTELVLNGKIGYMALLRNLNNLAKYKVSDAVIAKAAEILRDPERVKKSKQLPFRFWTAYENVHGNRILSDAISEAMDISVSNAPEFPGRTLIAVDASGSMSGDPIQKASLLAAAILKANVGADLILYDEKAYEITASGRSPVLDTAKSIQNKARGGGTNTSSVFKYATKKGDKYDRIVILSDNQSWQDSYYGSRGTQTAVDEYMKTTNADPYIFCVDIQGYGTKDISHPKAFHVAGWSDRILDFIGKMEKSESLIDYVKSYEI